MASLESMFADYAAHHQTRGNKWCHRFGIPLIMFSLLGLLRAVRLVAVEGFVLDAAITLVILASVVYVVLDWRFAAIMLMVSLLMWSAAPLVPFSGHVSLFLAGWALQFIGHGVYEKRQPAFLRNLVHLLVGPLWIVNDAIPLVEGRERGAPPAES